MKLITIISAKRCLSAFCALMLSLSTMHIVQAAPKAAPQKHDTRAALSPSLGYTLVDQSGALSPIMPPSPSNDLRTQSDDEDGYAVIGTKKELEKLALDKTAQAPQEPVATQDSKQVTQSEPAPEQPAQKAPHELIEQDLRDVVGAAKNAASSIWGAFTYGFNKTGQATRSVAQFVAHEVRVTFVDTDPAQDQGIHSPLPERYSIIPSTGKSDE